MKYIFYEIGKPKRYIESEKPLTLEEMQGYVKGFIEFAPLKNGQTICVNEEGIVNNLPYNRAITQEETEVDLGFGLRGNIIVGKLDSEGEFVGIE